MATLNRLFTTTIVSKLLITMALFGISLIVVAASFDCTLAAKELEKLICNDQLLSNYDSQLSEAYQLQLQDSIGFPKYALIGAQKDWIINIRDKCQDDGCLRMAYLNRLLVLLHVNASSSDADYVIAPEQLSKQIHFFQNELQRVGISGKLSSCTRLVRLNIQTITGIAPENASYGAICNLNKQGIQICENRMVGGLSIRFGTVYVGRAIADFTQTNCPYGD